LSAEVTIRPFREEDDASEVRELFIIVNRLLSPMSIRDAFDAYIARSLNEEMDRVAAYYRERGGGFWVALREAKIVGMFGLERATPDAMELRRMYVDPSVRRSGIARLMLRFAEAECRRLNVRRLELSTSELQPAALELYRHTGYRLLREVVAEQASNKTLGGGIRRYHFEKDPLGQNGLAGVIRKLRRESSSRRMHEGEGGVMIPQRHALRPPNRRSARRLRARPHHRRRERSREFEGVAVDLTENP
jgi:GNAT superfamily N-acetyltransferase